MSPDVFCFGDPAAGIVLIQMVGEHDLPLMEAECGLLRSLLPEKSFRLVAVEVTDWNRDLSPWPAPPVFGNEAFGDGGEKTLEYLIKECLPALGIRRNESSRLFLRGYSLAGLSALWSAYRTELFDGVAAVSPSVWFPGFVDYTKIHPLRTKAVYLSLGDREEKTRNPVMARVGDSIRVIHQGIEKSGLPCALEWNEGNHFREPERRMAKGFAWLMKR